MYTSSIIQKACALRLDGKTFAEIQAILQLKIPKSTLSTWFNKVDMPEKHKESVQKLNKENLKKARVLALEVLSKKRLSYLAELRSKNDYLVDKIDTDVQRLILTILYLSEGAKYPSSKFVALANSEPKIICLFLTLIKNCYSINESKIRIRVQCRLDQNAKQLQKYWSELTGIPLNQFYPTYKDKRTAGKKTTRQNYHGVCTVYYFSTEIQLELEFLAQTMLKFIITNGPMAQLASALPWHGRG